MLFNSFAFLFLYLPPVLIGYFLLGRYRADWAMGWLALASFFFYGYWNVHYLPLLLLSIVGNYWAAQKIMAADSGARKRWLQVSVAGNLALLAYFKYANFFVDTATALGAWRGAGLDVVLPIGISFFTFTQIAFLVDCYRGQVRETRLLHYALFVGYFPHLIAGPVLHHREMMPQFRTGGNTRPHAENFAIGFSVFVVGLAKKTLIADNLAPMVAPVFAAGAHPQMVEAWIGTLAYTLQLYFDFSGYSDMAIGLSRLFGIRLPLNFNSPYKAHDISEFWRRWHMTLSRFLRDYLYIPLGGKRDGASRRYRNLMLTMLLGGLWHGAGWTFVLWGGLHGIYLVLHHAWLHLSGRRVAGWWARWLTFVAVLLAWVVLRAPDMKTAVDIWRALIGANGLALPHGMAADAVWFSSLGLRPSYAGIRWIDFGGLGTPVLVIAMLLAFWAPNTQEIFGRQPGSYAPRPLRPAVWSWQPSRLWGLAFSVLLICCLFSMNKVTEFLYFQF